VLIVGAVPDIRAYIGRAAVVVAPLRIGGGTRLKILEAMAMGRPVVATRIGAEGIDAMPERDLLIADDPSELARATVRVLSDTRLACTVGMAGRALVQRLYDWEVLGSQLDRFIRTLLAQRRTYRFALGKERVG
jgi:glycosyltransferase involved in cell wall biosynthesis